MKEITWKSIGDFCGGVLLVLVLIAEFLIVRAL